MRLSGLGRKAAFLVAGVAAAGLVAAAAPAGAASAPAQAPAHGDARVAGGTTSVTTAPGVAGVLLGNGILPLPVPPGRISGISPRPLSLTYAFPISGGALDLKALTGRVDHRGGIVFVNARNGKTLKVTGFRIELRKAPRASELSAVVNGGPRVAIFTLDLGKAKVEPLGTTGLRVSGVGLSLTPGAAAALNSALGVKVFAGGLRFGTATSRVDLG